MMLVVSLLTVVALNGSNKSLVSNDDVEQTSIADFGAFVSAVGGTGVREVVPHYGSKHITGGNSGFTLFLYEQRGQLATFERGQEYFKEFPFESERVDLVRTELDARIRLERFWKDAQLDWQRMEVKTAQRINEHQSTNYVPLGPRRIFAFELYETSDDERRSFHTLRRARVYIDAQYGHILMAHSTYVPSEGAWRLTASESAARDTALAAWRQAGHVFHADQTTVSARWIRPRFGLAYRRDDRLLAGWVIEVKQKPTDEEIVAFAWVHGETGKLVHLHGPFPPPSTGE